MSTVRTDFPSEHPSRCKRFGALRSVTHALFWLGLLWFALGMMITFIPGGEQGWFTTVAILTAFGLLSAQRGYRLAALVFVIFSILAALDGRQRGIAYRQEMDRRTMSHPSQIDQK